MKTKIDKATSRILKGLQGKRVGVFIDDANLYFGFRSCGWRVDFKKFKKFLKSYCKIQLIDYHIAIPEKSDYVFKGTQKYLEKISPFIIVRKKPLKYIPVGKFITKKADCDVEITLDVVRNADKLDVVIIMSGDSDFVALKEYVVKDKKKEILFIAYKYNMAWELRLGNYIFLERIRRFVEFKN